MADTKDERIKEAKEELEFAVKTHEAVIDLTDFDEIKNDTSSFYVNLRDAFFHYTRMIDSYNNGQEFDRNYYALMEHLNRGLVDTFVHIFQELCDKTQCRLKEKEALCASVEQIKEIRAVLHLMKGLLLDLRLGGLGLNRIIGGTGTGDYSALTNGIAEFHKLNDKYAIVSRRTYVK